MPLNTIDDLEQSQKNWFDINAPFGKRCGYPDCCIKEFCDQSPELLKQAHTSANDHLRFRAAHINGQYTGFIPCLAHAQQILKGEITLQSLIKDRDKTLPEFPLA